MYVFSVCCVIKCFVYLYVNDTCIKMWKGNNKEAECSKETDHRRTIHRNSDMYVQDSLCSQALYTSPVYILIPEMKVHVFILIHEMRTLPLGALFLP